MSSLPFATELAPPTSIRDDLGIEVDRTESGVTRQRTVYDDGFAEMDLRWSLMSLADTETLRAWFRANRLEAFSFTLGSVVYTGRLVGAPQIRYVSPQWRSVTVPVRAVEVPAP